MRNKCMPSLCKAKDPFPACEGSLGASDVCCRYAGAHIRIDVPFALTYTLSFAPVVSGSPDAFCQCA